MYFANKMKEIFDNILKPAALRNQVIEEPSGVNECYSKKRQ
jgi:hypothetical protein